MRKEGKRRGGGNERKGRDGGGKGNGGRGNEKDGTGHGMGRDGWKRRTRMQREERGYSPNLQFLAPPLLIWTLIP